MSDKRLQLAVDLTQIPTAAGREGRVLAFIDAWLAARPGLRKSTDKAGNVVITLAPTSKRPKPGKPLFITAHLDHPAFVVERIVAPGVLELSFRGGVMDAFFELAPITLHTAQGPVSATLTGPADTETPAGKHYLAELDDSAGLVPAYAMNHTHGTITLPEWVPAAHSTNLSSSAFVGIHFSSLTVLRFVTSRAGLAAA